MDPQLLLFRRQYFQLFEPDFLAWPPKQLLRDADVQEWLYNHLFNMEKSSYLPSDRYRFRVLKQLVNKIEKAIEDPEEDVGCHFCFTSYDVILHVSHRFISFLICFRMRTGDIRRLDVFSLHPHLLRPSFRNSSSPAKILRNFLLSTSRSFHLILARERRTHGHSLRTAKPHLRFQYHWVPNLGGSFTPRILLSQQA